MEGDGDYDFESPVWWDPKVRRVVLDARSFEPCLFLVRGTEFVLASGHEVICSGDLGRVGYSWPERIELPVCDLAVDGRIYRIYFCHPHPQARPFEGSTADEITEVVTLAGRPGGVATRRISVMRMPSHTSLNPGRKRMQRFQALLP
ncbi:hypothetical protein LQ327_10170 [Actinomycetospora endophytica]|uniref:Uncharacterized protein n=1 Tax=Actinomycetospora endophytica TaxID=2291215 RepID=A0ABS8P656_9PSEU|nr:hypothetical protein [Actinomycetospora endophytica]MCD2193742.1 hypothetical protein [Actinomycetospora endophytica]